MDNLKLILLFMLIVSVITACEKILLKPRPGDSLLDAPVERLNYEQNRLFLAGDAAFNAEVFTAQKGPGPLFVATSCGSCHAGDGKGIHFQHSRGLAKKIIAGTCSFIWAGHSCRRPVEPNAGYQFSTNATNRITVLRLNYRYQRQKDILSNPPSRLAGHYKRIET